MSAIFGVSQTSQASPNALPETNAALAQLSGAGTCRAEEPIATVEAPTLGELWILRPVEINLQLHLEQAPDKAVVERILNSVEAHNPDWRVTVFVSPHFALSDPDAVRAIERRGHQIAVVGTGEQLPLTTLSYNEQRASLERAMLAVRAAVYYPQEVVDWKPQDFDWNADTLLALQSLQVRSISDLFTCGDSFLCQCPYALNLGKVTFPYPMQTEFWAIPISEIQQGSEALALDDRRVFAGSVTPQDYLGYLLQKYGEQQETKDPLIIAVHPSIVGMDDARLEVLDLFLDHVVNTGGKLVTLNNLMSQSYITNFNVQSPSAPVPVGSQATLTVTYRSTLYCPKYRFRAYGKYEGENWQLVASGCQYVSTGDHTLYLQPTIPKPPGSQTVYTVTVVGQASYGSCDNSDPDWPTLDKYEVKKEVQISVLPRCIPLPGRTAGDPNNRLDVVFVPDTDYGTPQNIDTWLPTFLNEINAQIDQRLNGKSPVTDNLNRFNFYYTRDQGNAEESSCGPSSTLPTDLVRDCSFADVIVVFHKTTFGDCSSVDQNPDILSAEGPIGRSFIHESGHGMFGLADEYDGNTSYFQPNPNPNIWATKDACRTDATSAGWNPDDCNKFTDRQGDWWKLGTTNYIMKDGTYFDNGWGAPASRRISWILDQYTPTLSTMAGVLAVPLQSNTTQLNLTLSDSGFVVNQIRRVRDVPPNQLTGSYAYRARLLSFGGQVLGEFGFGNPRYIYAEEGYPYPTYLSTASFALHLPYYYDAKTVQIYDAGGTLVRTIDIASIASGGIAGAVTDNNGQPVAGARVEVIGPDLTNVATAANGQYSIQGLQAGSYAVNIIPPASSNLIPAVSSVSVYAGQMSTINVSLQLGTTVQGRVTSAAGRPIPNAILYVSGYETPRYSTDNNGYYVMKGLRPGSYTLNIDSTRNYHIYVNGQFVRQGTSVDLTAVAGQGITVDFVEPAIVYLPVVLKNMQYTPYNWLDATNGGTIIAQGDDTYQYVSLPFAFNFYGSTYTGLYVSSNGFVSFGSGYSSYSNNCIPSTSTPNNAIYAFWDDLVPTGGGNGNIYVKQIDSGTFVIEWHRVRKYGTSDYQTFEIVLRSDHSITLQYQFVSNTGSATVGVENATGTLAKQHICNGVGTPLTNQLAIRYTTP